MSFSQTFMCLRLLKSIVDERRGSTVQAAVNVEKLLEHVTGEFDAVLRDKVRDKLGWL